MRMRPTTTNNPRSPNSDQTPVEVFFFRLDGFFLTGGLLVVAFLVGRRGTKDRLIS